MKLLSIFLFLTLVLTSSVIWAKPHNTADTPPPTEEKPPIDPMFSEKNLIVSPLPKELEEQLKPPKSYPYHHAITPRISALIDMEKIIDEKKLDYLIGFTYLFKKYYSPKWELGIDIGNNSIAFLNFSRRWIFNERQGLRPYFKLGLTHKMEAKGKLANISNLEAFLGRASLGIEDLLSDPYSFRMEIEVAVGKNDFLGFFSIGYSWGLN